MGKGEGDDDLCQLFLLLLYLGPWGIIMLPAFLTGGYGIPAIEAVNARNALVNNFNTELPVFKLMSQSFAASTWSVSVNGASSVPLTLVTAPDDLHEKTIAGKPALGVYLAARFESPILRSSPGLSTWTVDVKFANATILSQSFSRLNGTMEISNLCFRVMPDSPTTYVQDGVQGLSSNPSVSALFVPGVGCAFTNVVNMSQQSGMDMSFARYGPAGSVTGPRLTVRLAADPYITASVLTQGVSSCSSGVISSSAISCGATTSFGKVGLPLGVAIALVAFGAIWTVFVNCCLPVVYCKMGGNQTFQEFLCMVILGVCMAPCLLIGSCCTIMTSHDTNLKAQKAPLIEHDAGIDAAQQTPIEKV